MSTTGHSGWGRGAADCSKAHVRLRASSDSSCKEEHLERKCFSLAHMHTLPLNINARLALTLFVPRICRRNHLKLQFFANYRSMRYKSAF